MYKDREAPNKNCNKKKHSLNRSYLVHSRLHGGSRRRPVPRVLSALGVRSTKAHVRLVRLRWMPR